ncbi:MAG: phosphate ABC transporter substrate-binding protein [bacterium]|nr:phosphate ABC transporter substrate-binding protein [bacterium]
MKNAIFIVFAVIMTFCFGQAEAQQSDVQVVVHASSSLTSVAKKDLSRIFMKQRSKWSTGERAKPIDQRKNSEVRASFSQSVLGKNMAEIDSFWQSQVFSGKASPPAQVASDAEVIEFVRRNPGAVGYVAASADVSGVKVLTLH